MYLSAFYIFLLSGTVYFDMGHKNPKIIYDDHDYLIYRKLPDKTVWLCTQYHKKNRCKAKVMTSGKNAVIIGSHNHPSVLRSQLRNRMVSQQINIRKVKHQDFVRINLI